MNANGYVHPQETLAHETLHSTGRSIHRNGGGATSPVITRYADEEIEARSRRRYNEAAYDSNDNMDLEISHGK